MKQSPFYSLSRIRNVGPLAAQIKNEDPEVIAGVVAHLKPIHGAELLKSLEDNKLAEVIRIVWEIEA